MLDLLTPLQTRKKLGTELAADQLVPVSIERQEPENHSFALNSPEDVLQALKSKPDLRTLGRALRWLNSNFGDADDFNVKKPSPKAAQLVFALVNDVVPDYWEILHPKATSGRPKEARQLLQCLSSVAGIGVILSRLRQLLDVLKDPRGRSEVDVIGRTQPLELVISLVEELFAGDSFIIRVWTDINAFISQPSHKQLQWREFVSLMAAGKVLSILSEANAVLRDLSSSIRASSWVDDGNQYALWLGRNIQYMTKALSADDVEGFEALSQFLSKAFNLGYTGQLNC